MNWLAHAEDWIKRRFKGKPRPVGPLIHLYAFHPHTAAPAEDDEIAEYRKANPPKPTDKYVEKFYWVKPPGKTEWERCEVHNFAFAYYVADGATVETHEEFIPEIK